MIRSVQVQFCRAKPCERNSRRDSKTTSTIRLSSSQVPRRAQTKLPMPYHVFRHGSAGFSRYYWHTLVDQTDEKLLVETIIPIALHEDGRFYTLGRGNFAKRLSYALCRALMTREDSGGETFNTSEIVGASVAAGISLLYYAAQYRTWPRTGQRWLTNLLVDSSTFAVREFWLSSIGRSSVEKTRLTLGSSLSAVPPKERC